jgi:membrane-associated phospholipid phosphatase
VHYAGDVLGGWLIGFSLAVMIFFIWDSLPQSQKKSDA